MRKTETSPMTWEDFIFLRDGLKREIEKTLDDKKRTQLAKVSLGIVMGCYFGLRYSDLSLIRWGDIGGKSELQIKEIKTGKSRVITINDFVSDYASFCFRNCTNISYGEEIISGRFGDPLTISYFNRKLKQILIRYNISFSNASSHVLRKTFGKRVYENGGRSHDSLLMLMKIFNHSQVSITTKYLGITEELIKDVYINLD